jgi:hypothetical protein
MRRSNEVVDIVARGQTEGASDESEFLGGVDHGIKDAS